MAPNVFCGPTSSPVRPAVAGSGVYDEYGRGASRTVAPRSSRMRAGSRLTRYEYRDSRASTPSKICDDTAAPPTCCSRSSSRTRRPARARYAAATRPLCPPPTMTASTSRGSAAISSAQVALDLVGGPHRRVAGIATGFAQRPTLPQQVPALVELDLERPQPLVLLGLADLAVLELLSECLLLGDEVVNTRQGSRCLGRRLISGPLSRSQVCPTRVGRVSSKPEIEFPSGPAPAQLVVEDLVVGDGPEAVPGANVEVHYVGVEYDTGDEFDSSWGRGQSIEFPLQGLIQGWQDGIPGMKVGGRRQLIIPPAQAYGPAGSGHQLSGKTLIFVIDLLSTRHAGTSRISAAEAAAAIRRMPPSGLSSNAAVPPCKCAC